MPTVRDRGKQRDRERKARQRRAANIDLMRERVTSLEASVLAVRTLNDNVWERFLNANAMRARRMLLLAKEAKELMDEQAQLYRLLQEHKLSSTVIAAMLTDYPASDWERDVERWRELARRHYKPWTLEACQREIEAALKEVNAFRWSTGKTTTGIRFLGWSDLRRVDAVRGAFQFEFQKEFRGFDMMDSVNAGWDTFTDEKTFQEVIVGHRFLGVQEILQQLAPNIMILRGVVRFPSVAGDIHRVYLVFRVKTERGFTQCVRSIICPELMSAIQGPNDLWASNFIWFEWEQLEGDNDTMAYSDRIGGSLRGIDIEHMNRWMLEIFGCVLRKERVAMTHHLLTNDLSPCVAAF